MTREQLIEKLWQEHMLTSNGGGDDDFQHFCSALNAALNAQARGNLDEVRMVASEIDVDDEDREVVTYRVLSEILNEDPEVTP